MNEFKRKGNFTIKDYLTDNEKKIILNVISEVYSKHLSLDWKKFPIESEYFHNELLKLNLKTPHRFQVP